MSSNAFFLLRWPCLLLACSLMAACAGPGAGGLFKKRSPHQVYAQRLKDAGFDRTAMGRAWLASADSSLKKAMTVTVPYKETGYFASERVPAAAFRFEAKEGEKLTITLAKKPAGDFNIYMDLFGDTPGDQPELLGFADTSGKSLSYDVDDTGFYLLRLQPELLRSGEYTLTITNGPSLAYPIKAPGTNHIKSFWGDGRDAGTRKHEGIDLFAAYRTPVVAAAEGIISRVNENRLGGKVVWLRPTGKDYRLYYAHLDTQLVNDGQQVNIGDTLGLMGNTGNARTTPPHLHFGIYTFGGAVDPLPFVKKAVKKPGEVRAPLESLNLIVRSANKVTPLYSSPDRASVVSDVPLQTTMFVEAASSNMYKVSLPDGLGGYISSESVRPAVQPIRQLRLAAGQTLFDQPRKPAARKAVIAAGRSVDILGNFGDYYLVRDSENGRGWITK